MRVAVCIITCQRPEGLKRLLEGLNQLVFKKCQPSRLAVIVVDNDPKGSACDFCEQIKPEFKWILQCDIEPRRGIPFARNKAIACAGNDVDFIVFIDDDEVPDPLWLDELLSVQALYNADSVSGPVLPHFEQPVPDWVTKGRFFERPRHATGHHLKGAATNNVLIRAEVLRKLEPAFDERLALCGGSDWHFFKRVYHAGYKMVWADEALAYEWIPASRANWKWLLQRSYRLGNTESFCEIDLNPSLAVRTMCAVKGVRRIIRGSLFMPIALLLGKQKFIKNLRYISHSAGMLSGVVGGRYDEYRKVHNV